MVPTLRNLIIAGLILLFGISVFLYIGTKTDNTITLNELSITEKPLRKLLESPGVIVLEAREYPWSALGRLNVGGKHFCNAVMVGSDKVLTSASCLFDKTKGKWFNNSEITYVGAYQRDNAELNAQISRFEIAEGYSPQNKTLASLSLNWALVKLSSKLGTKTGWLGVTESDTPGQIFPAGYRRGWEHALVTYPYCHANKAKTLCPTANIDGLLNWFSLSDNQLSLSPPSGVDTILNNWSLSSSGKAPQNGSKITAVPLDTIGRLLKDKGYIAGTSLTIEVLKSALEKAKEDGAITKDDRIGLNTLYQLFEDLKQQTAEKTSTS